VVLGAVCAASVTMAVLMLGPPATTQQAQSRVVTAELGVVQSTVSGSGTLAPADQANLNFKTSGVLSAVDVSAGQHVAKGQWLAQINASGAQASLTEAQANLSAAQAKLAETIANPSGSTTAGSSSGGAAAATAANASTAPAPAGTVLVAYRSCQRVQRGPPRRR
jgi:multidrug efflux pump subunit AcrA (membrane-fusion protein)